MLFVQSLFVKNLKKIIKRNSIIFILIFFGSEGIGTWDISFQYATDNNTLLYVIW